MAAFGIFSALLVIVAVWEYKGLEASVKAFQNTSKLKFVFQTGFLPYAAGMAAWTGYLLLFGFVWSSILFPRRDWVEKVIFSLCAGAVLMPISYHIPFFFALAGKVIANLLGQGSPAFADAIIKARGFLLVNNHEQVYQFVNISLFLILGLIILVGKRFSSRPALTP